MPICRLVLALLIFVSSVLAADLHVLPNATIKGDLVSLDGKNVVMKTDAGNVTQPLMTVLAIEFQPVPANLGASFTQVLLTDGTVLNCKPDGVAFDGKKVQLTVLPDLKLELPITALTYILKDAHDPKVRDNPDWKSIYKSRRNEDLLVLWREGRLNGLGGTFPDGKGTSLHFLLQGAGSPRPIDLANKNVQGCIFVNKPSTDAPATLCKLYDIHQNVLLVSSVEIKEGGDFLITTCAGAKISYPRGLVARLDFSTAKRVYLSDLDPQVLLEPASDVFTGPFHRDRTPDTPQLQLGREKFAKGLFLRAPTKLLYKLDGEYSEFSATVGIDEGVGGKRDARLIIEGDGKELFSGEFTKKDKQRDIKLNVKDVQELRITVESVELLGFVYGCHLDLADAKLTK